MDVASRGRNPVNKGLMPSGGLKMGFDQIFQLGPATLGARTHLSLDKGCPETRPIHPPTAGKIVAIPEVGGLHHRYERRAA